MQTRPPGFSRTTALLLILAASLGQSTYAQKTAPTAAAEKADDTIMMSEFTVQPEPNRGYVASETLTGSRVATKIVDLPYTVNVMTSEFFQEFGLFELGDNLTHIGGFTGLDIGGNFTLRGFASTSQLRDGFYRLGRYGASNVDRMEIIKGSNAAIYGRSSPGGMLNMISKQPKSKAAQSLSLTYGDYGTRRATLEATGPLFKGTLGKTSYILTASHLVRDFDQDYALNRNQEYYLAVKHSFADNSNLMVSAEYFLQVRHGPTVNAPLITDLKGTASNLDDVAIGYAKNLAGYNAYGPHSELNRGNIAFTATYDKRLSDVWSTRIASNYFRARRWDYNQNTGFGSININPAVAAPITTTRGATPNKLIINEDGGGFQGDLLAHYWMFDRAIENRTLLTLDINDYYRWDPTWNYGPSTNPDIAAWNAAGSGRVVTLNADYTPTAPLTYFSKDFQWGNEQLTRLTRRRASVVGGLLRQQMSLFNGRLLAYAGARFDAVRFQQRDYTTLAAAFSIFPSFGNYAPGQMISKRVNQLKPNVGVNYKITPNLRAFANYSESYFVNQTDNPVVFADPGYKPEIANGYDYGFKGSLFEDRLNFTISGFYATRENVSVTNLVESPLGSGSFVSVQQRDGNQLVRGYEIDISWNATKEVSFTGSWGHVYSIYTDFGSGKPLSIGRRVNGVSPQNGSVSVRYSPTSAMLKGFSANLGVTYVAATPTELPDAGDFYLSGTTILTRTTRQWALTVPSFAIWSTGLRYQFRPSAKLTQTVALNVNNIFDKDYLKVSKQLGDRRGIYFSYTIAH